MKVYCNVSEDNYLLLQKHFEEGDAKSIYAINREFAPYYCPACELNYCIRYWITEETYEDLLSFSTV